MFKKLKFSMIPQIRKRDLHPKSKNKYPMIPSYTKLFLTLVTRRRQSCYFHIIKALVRCVTHFHSHVFISCYVCNFACKNFLTPAELRWSDAKLLLLLLGLSQGKNLSMLLFRRVMTTIYISSTHLQLWNLRISQ